MFQFSYLSIDAVDIYLDYLEGFSIAFLVGGC